MEPEKNERPDPVEITRDSDTVEEARTRIDETQAVRKAGPIQFPTFRYAKDGRSQIVRSPQELEELEADGGDWQDTPHPAGTEYVPGGIRTFASPVGAVDARGAAARYDRPVSEVALTTALPRNEAGSVPSAQAETQQRQAQSPVSAAGSPMEGEIARLQGELAKLQDENDSLKVAQKKAQSTDSKGQDSRAADAADADSDARETAKREAEVRKQLEGEETTRRQSEEHARAQETKAKGAAKTKGRSK